MRKKTPPTSRQRAKILQPLETKLTTFIAKKTPKPELEQQLKLKWPPDVKSSQSR
jgi:hypothetical protein